MKLTSPHIRSVIRMLLFVGSILLTGCDFTGVSDTEIEYRQTRFRRVDSLSVQAIGISSDSLYILIVSEDTTGGN